MNEVNERIKQLRSVLNLTQIEFSEKIYVSQSTFGDIELGGRKPNDRILKLISTEFNVSFDWLKNGIGEIFDEERPDIKLENLIRIYKKLDKTLQNYLLEQSELLLKLSEENVINKK